MGGCVGPEGLKCYILVIYSDFLRFNTIAAEMIL
jgi:hypothetical protein